MKRYLSLYGMLIRINLQQILVYRMGFVTSMFTGILWAIFSVSTIYFLTAKTGAIYGWSREELLLLAGSYSIFIGLFHMFFSRNFERFARLVDHGELDGLLIKPIDGQFSLSVWQISFAHVFRILFGIGFNIYILSIMHVQVKIISVILSVGLLVVGLTIMYSIWFITSCLMIWDPKVSNIVELLFNITSISRYPMDIYREVNQFVFLCLLPLLILITTPTRILFGQITFWEIMNYLLMCMGLLLASRLMWLFAIRHYTGASG